VGLHLYFKIHLPANGIHLNGWGVYVGHLTLGPQVGDNDARFHLGELSFDVVLGCDRHLTIEKHGPLRVILDAILVYDLDRLVNVKNLVDLLQNRRANA
jgi:hypothetical protein